MVSLLSLSHCFLPSFCLCSGQLCFPRSVDIAAGEVALQMVFGDLTNSGCCQFRIMRDAIRG